MTVIRLSPSPSTVVSVLLEGCNAGSLSSTGSSEPGGDKAADPASTLVEMVFSSVVLIVLLLIMVLELNFLSEVSVTLSAIVS